MQVVVLGFHRSGTSTVTRLINMMGCYCFAENKSAGFNDENPKGFWERLDVIELNNEILAHQNCNWDNIGGYNPNLPLPEHTNPLETIDYRIKNVILDLDAHRPWVVKDPRMCLTFQHWRPNLEIPVCIIVHRDPYEIAISLKTRNNMPISYGFSLWEVYCSNLINSTQNMKKIFINYADLMKDPVGQIKNLYQALVENHVQNIRLPQDEEILAFINPSLYRSKAKEPYSLSDLLNAKQMELIEYMTGQKEATEVITPSATSLSTLDEYSQHLNNYKTLESGYINSISKLEEENAHLNSALDDAKRQLEQQIQSYNKNIFHKVIRKLFFQKDYLNLVHYLEHANSKIQNNGENKLCLATN